MATSTSRDFTKPDDLSDVKLIIQGTKLYVHRQYLAEWSAVWRKIFTSKNVLGHNPIEIELPDQNLHQFVELLHCIYPSQKPISDTNVSFLLEMAEEFQMDYLKKKCEEFLVNKDKSLELLVLAEKYQLKNLHHKCVEFAKMKNIEEIERNPECKKLDTSTIIKIYKAKINMLKEFGNDMKNRENRLGRDYDRAVAQRDRLRASTQAIKKIWDTPNKRCFRHMNNEKFDFTCANCNEKIFFEIRRLCGEGQFLQRCYTINGVKI